MRRTLVTSLLLGTLLVLLTGPAVARVHDDLPHVPAASTQEEAASPDTRLAAEDPTPGPTAEPGESTDSDGPTPALVVVGVLLGIAAIVGAIARYRSIRP